MPKQCRNKLKSKGWYFRLKGLLYNKNDSNCFKVSN